MSALLLGTGRRAFGSGGGQWRGSLTRLRSQAHEKTTGEEDVSLTAAARSVAEQTLGRAKHGLIVRVRSISDGMGAPSSSRRGGPRLPEFADGSPLWSEGTGANSLASSTSTLVRQLSAGSQSAPSFARQRSTGSGSSNPVANNAANAAANMMVRQLSTGAAAAAARAPRTAAASAGRGHWRGALTRLRSVTGDGNEEGAKP